MNKGTVNAFRRGIFFLLAAGLTACMPGDTEVVGLPVVPSEAALHGFEAKYAEAEGVSWEKEQGFYVARFMRGTAPVCAWFREDGEWFLSEEASSFDRLCPRVVRTFLRSAYAGWKVEEVTLLDRRDMDTVYGISAVDDKRSVHLHYSKFGDFIKASAGEMADGHRPVEIPRPISRTLDSLFDSPLILDLWRNDLAINMAVRDDGVCSFVAFSYAYDWICTFRNIAKAEVKPEVWDAFRASAYGHFPVEHFRVSQNGMGLSYLFYFSDGKGKRYILYIKENGVPDCLVSY
ncbi:MAG: PepSY-like domain-containing protein [Tannerellaceae bacterium]|nr:PepSY-like domain-containing protein [Tannerellaceae bacterium]